MLYCTISHGLVYVSIGPPFCLLFSFLRSIMSCLVRHLGRSPIIPKKGLVVRAFNPDRTASSSLSQWDNSAPTPVDVMSEFQLMSTKVRFGMLVTMVTTTWSEKETRFESKRFWKRNTVADLGKLKKWSLVELVAYESGRKETFILHMMTTLMTSWLTCQLTNAWNIEWRHRLTVNWQRFHGDSWRSALT